MSVTGYMYNINATKKLGELELKEGLEGNRSWHHQFRHSAYIYIGGLHPGMTEGDVAIVFAQFGEIVDVNLVRDKSTGKSKGFAFVCFEDQRSTILAVDNMNGFQLLNRALRVDHVDKYKAPKILDEEQQDEDGDPKLLEYKATGAEGAGANVYNVLSSQRRIAEVQDQRRAKPAGQAPPEDEDEAWAKAFEEGLKDRRGDGGKSKKKKKKKMKEKFKKELEELKRMKMETKRLKKETKKAKEAAKAKSGSSKAAKQQGAAEGKEAKRKKPESESSGAASDSSETSSDESSEDSGHSDDKKRRKAARR